MCEIFKVHNKDNRATSHDIAFLLKWLTKNYFLTILVTVNHFHKKRSTMERRSGAFTVSFEQISHIVLVFPLKTLNESVPYPELF